CMTTWWTPNYW
nr:immunoglobulin heavy chain junction region [Macaca mulatta]